MGTDQMDHFKDALIQRQAELEQQLLQGKHAAAPVELDPARVGRLSRMDALQSQALGQATQLRRQRELQRVKSALARLEAGDFGHCLECGEAIAPKRLEHDPSVPLCMNCSNAR